jgi:hypothetical protein
MGLLRCVFAVGFAAAVAAAGVMAAGAAPCESLAALALPNATITVTQTVPAGPFTPPGGRETQNPKPFCRVAGVIKPTSDSDIRFEVWLPAAEWNGKFLGVGNGGFAGSIDFNSLGLAVGAGYAAAATDTGHQAGTVDARWALNHPEKAIDFGYRAVHETALKAKAVIAAFYGSQPKHSYFSSCSNGGRQGLMEAQRYPEDYDGIVSGAPANYWTHLVTVGVWDVLALSGEHYIPAAKVPAIEAAAVAACDAADGLKDGIISDPVKCRFDPSSLVCPGADSPSCLTGPQAAALKKLYSGPRSAKGESTFPGHMPGGEAGAGGWPSWVTGPAPERSTGYGFGTQFFANMVFSDAAWDYHTFDVDRDTKAADDKMASVLNATDPDLSRFRQRGGKLILYHGWSDAAISAVNSITYFQSVQRKLGEKQTDGFVRLFMAPGVQHCSGGPGPDSFGQGAGAPGDASQNINKALERWVEEGVAPAQIVATKYRTGNLAGSGATRTRPLCPYPQVANYKGSGSIDDAANFACAAPSR